MRRIAEKRQHNFFYANVVGEGVSQIPTVEVIISTLYGNFRRRSYTLLNIFMPSAVCWNWKISGVRNINVIHQYTGYRNIGIRICEHVCDDQNEVWDCKWHSIFIINFSTNHRPANKVFASHVNAVLLPVDSYAYFLRKKTFYINFHTNFHKYYYLLCFPTKKILLNGLHPNLKNQTLVIWRCR